MTAVLDRPGRIQVQLRRPHPEQRRILGEAARFNVLCCGRRWGKNVLAIDRVAEIVLRGYPTGWFAPTYKVLNDSWRDLKRALAPVTAHCTDTDHRIELITGGSLECWSLKDAEDPARGRKYKRIVIDEAAMVAGLETAWQEAIRPTLTDFRGDAYFLSTPKGLNYFHTLYQRGVDPTETDWRSWQQPTANNPHIDPDEIEDARNELPERVFAQEYLAQFLEDGAGVFRKVNEAAVLEPSQPQKGHWYVMGVDWAKLSDFTVLSVLDGCCAKQVALDRFQQIDYTLQVARLRGMADRFKPRVIIAEANAMGAPLVEQLARMDLPVQPYVPTNATKAVVVESLALALEQGRLQLLNDRVQTGELLAFEAERLPSGLIRYAATGHDDTVIALALAWQAIADAAANREIANLMRGGLSMQVKTAPAEATKPNNDRAVARWMRGER